jgi:hypothetical protein
MGDLCLSPRIKRAGRRKINIEFIHDKNRRQITFSKRKSGLMKKAYELVTLTGTQVLLLVASETGHVYTFASKKLEPFITQPAGKNLIQECLNAPDPPSHEFDAQESSEAQQSEAVGQVPRTIGLSEIPWTCMLLAGRRVPRAPGFNRAHLRDLQNLVSSWSIALGLDLQAVAGGLFGPGPDSEPIHLDVVVGLRIVGMDSDQGLNGPSTPLDITALKSSVIRADTLIPEEMWKEISSRSYVVKEPTLDNSQPAADHNSFPVPEDMWKMRVNLSNPSGVPPVLHQVTEIYLTQSWGGNLQSGGLVFGALSMCDPHVVVGIQVADGLDVTPIDIRDEAHFERLKATQHIPGHKAYYLIAQ